MIKRVLGFTSIALVVVLLLEGCAFEGDQPLGDLYTGNVYPTHNLTYSVGSERLTYHEGWFQDMSVIGGANIGGYLGVAGISRLGGLVDYLEIVPGGTLTLYGSARVINETWIDAGGIKSPGSKPALEIAHGTLEVPAWQFADEVLVANQESVSFTMRIPERMDRSVSPTITIGWSTTTVDPGDDSQQVKWQLEYLWRSANEDTTAGAEGTLTALSSASTTAEGLVVITFTGINVPSASDICISCRIKRLSADIQDTVADDVELLGVCMLWTSNRLGS